MSIEQSPTYYPIDLFCSDDAEVQGKADTLASLGASGIVGVVDFDKTLTTNGPKDLTSWDAAAPFLPERARQEEEELNATYRDLEERPGGLTLQDADDWWNGTLDIWRKNRVNVDDMAEYGGENIKLRDDAIEFIRLLERHDVPLIVVSAGLSIIIKRVFERNGVRATEIVATDLETDENGILTGWDQSRMVHNHNKRARSQAAVMPFIETRKGVLLAGDSYEDPFMIADEQADGLTVIRTRVGDPYKIPPSKVSKYLRESFKAGYDAVSLSGMVPIRRLGAYAISGADTLA